MRILVLTVAVGLALAQEPPTIKVEVNIVNLLCSVRNNRGALVSNLTKDDFLVSEEGKPQEIRYFTRETDLPLTIGLLVDLSGSQKNLIETERRAAHNFFSNVLRKKDLAFLIGFGADAELVQDLTGSLVLLRDGLDSLKLNTPPPMTQPGPVPTIYKQRGTVLFDAVYLAASERLRSEVGRKAIVVITDGVDVGSRLKLTDAIEAAQKSDAIIYSIYYADTRYFGGGGSSDLRRMSEETGGRMFEVGRRTTLDDIFRQIQEEMRSQYSIGYVPTNSVKDGSYRRVEVRTREKGLKVQARKGYYF